MSECVCEYVCVCVCVCECVCVCVCVCVFSLLPLEGQVRRTQLDDTKSLKMGLGFRV